MFDGDRKDVLLLSELDRYTLKRLLTLFLFFTLILAGAYWINQSVRSLSYVIPNIHSLQTFMSLTLWHLVRSLMIVMPLTGFIAATYFTVQLHLSRELAAIYSTGISLRTLLRPYLAFATVVGILVAIYAHQVGPYSRFAIGELNHRIVHNFAIGPSHTNRFNFPGRNLAIFVDDITVDQKLTNIIVFDYAPGDRENLHFAESAYMLRANNSVDLVMLHGQSVLLNKTNHTVANLNFDDVTVSLSAVLAAPPRRIPGIREFTSFRLHDDEALADGEVHFGTEQIRLETNLRNSELVHSLFLVLLGAVPVLSITGRGHGAPLACLAAAVLGFGTFLLAETLQAFVGQEPDLWPTLYTASGVGLLAVAILLFRLHAVGRQ